MAEQRWRLDGGRALLDAAGRTLVVDGQPARLGGRAFDLLVALVAHHDRVVPKQELLDLVWPGLVVEENNLQVQVLTLRKVLGNGAIVTVSGRGYRLATEVIAAVAAAAAPAPTASLEPTRASAPPAAPAPARVEPSTAATDLIGRDALLARVEQALADPTARLVTLVGPGGSGKTRLALRATAARADVMPDGAYSVMLAPLRDGALATASLAAALGLQESGAATAADLVRAFLRPRRVLLMLDNLEHLPGIGAWVEQLLTDAPGLQVLATSRVHLRVAGEREIGVAPLALPADDDLTTIRAAPAVQLFARSAAAQGRTLDSTDDLRAAATICRQLDGLPLALELAAARLRLLTPTLLAARLQQRLPLLTAALPGLPARQQTLRSTIAWSHDLLDEPTRRLLRRLAVFAGGCALEAAEAVDDDPATLLDRLETLLDHHLVQRLDDVEGEPRFAMLETIREFAAEQLEAAGETAAMRERHARWFLALAERAAPEVASAARRPWLARLRADLNNVRAALHWFARERPDPDAAVALAGAMAWPWYFEGLYKEGRAWMNEVLALPGAPTDGAPRARLLSGAARLAMYAGDGRSASALADDSTRLWRALGDGAEARLGLAFACFHAGIAGIMAGDLSGSRSALGEALALFRGLEHPWGIALGCSYLGTAFALPPGTEAQARPLLLEGRARFRALGDEWGSTVSSHYLGSLALRTGDLVAARELTDEMLANAREVGDRYRIARNLHQLAEIDLAEQRRPAALGRLAESLALNAEQDRRGDVALQLRLIARLAEEAGDDAAAVRLAALAAQHAGSERTMPPDDIAAHDQRVERLRSRLDGAAFEAAWARGVADRFGDVSDWLRTWAERDARAHPTTSTRQA